MNAEKLIQLAIEAMDRAYVPYSKFKVGAALLCKDGTVYQGCNIENSSYGPSNCAERTAVFRAVFDGHRELSAIAVCGGIDGEIADFLSPCGTCRQVLREFCDDDFIIYMIGPDGTYKTGTLGELLPYTAKP